MKLDLVRRHPVDQDITIHQQEKKRSLIVFSAHPVLTALELFQRVMEEERALMVFARRATTVLRAV